MNFNPLALYNSTSDFTEAGDWRGVFDQIRTPNNQSLVLSTPTPKSVYQGFCLGRMCQGKKRKMSAKVYYDFYWKSQALVDSNAYIRRGQTPPIRINNSYTERMLLTCPHCHSWISLHKFKIDCVGHPPKTSIHSSCWMD